MATPQVPEFWPMALGASADTVEIPDTTPAGEGIPSFTSLFPILTQIDPTAGGVFVQRSWMNGLFQLLGNNIWFLQHGGLFPWNAAFEYPVGAHVLGSNNNEYIALQSSTGQDPTQDSTGETWQNVTTFLGTSFLPLSGGTMTGTLTLKGDPTENLQAATKQYVDERSQSFIGMIAPFASKNLPEGWMICDGSSVLFADWPEFKTAYDEGRFTGMTVSSSTPAQVGKFVLNGSTGVYLPDLTGLFVQASAAVTAGAYVAPGLPNIKGSFNGAQLIDDAATPSVTGAFSVGGAQPYDTPSSPADNTQNGFSFSAAQYNAIYSDSINTVQPPTVQYVMAMYLGKPAAAA